MQHQLDVQFDSDLFCLNRTINTAQLAGFEYGVCIPCRGEQNPPQKKVYSECDTKLHLIVVRPETVWKNTEPTDNTNRGKVDLEKNYDRILIKKSKLNTPIE